MEFSEAVSRPARSQAAGWAALLVDLAVAGCLPAAMLFAISVGWALGSVFGATVIAVVLLFERGTYSPNRGAVVAVAAWLYGLMSLFAIVIGTELACPQPTETWAAWAAAGAVLAGLMLLSLRKGFLWGVPIAVLLAFLVFFTVYAKLPAVPLDCGVD